MTPATLAPLPTVQPTGARRRGLLAGALQEAFTAAVRLRADRQVVTDAELFRSQVKRLLAAADQEARAAGYAGDSVRLVVYAFVAFLDESVLNSGQPVFSAWPRQSLQEEIFGDHMAGETFFRNVQELLARQDSEELADVLEVFLLCLLLGFRGRYAAEGSHGVEGLISTIQEKIRRVRGEHGPLSPRWMLPPDERVPSATDPWLRRLGITAAVTAAGTLLLFVLFRLSLNSDISEVQRVASQLVP